MQSILYALPFRDKLVSPFYRRTTSCVAEQAFQINPKERPVIDEMLNQLEEIAAARGVSLSAPVAAPQSDPVPAPAKSPVEGE